ncbi:MAG: aromatic acid exporter family protein [Lachnospiraceae bacterium]
MLGRDAWHQAIKIAVGSALAIFVAESMGLQYATSAGIVTLLTIQHTRKDTFALAFRRIVSFIITAVTAFFCVTLIPTHSIAFGVFLFIVVAISYKLGWNGAISINAVIGTHFILMEQQFTLALLWNEAMMVFIGIFIAILCNTHMLSNEKEMQMDIEYIDMKMLKNLSYIADHLDSQMKLSKDKEVLEELIVYIDKAEQKAYANLHNTMKNHAKYYVEYLEARRQQCAIILHVCYIVAHHDFIVDEAKIVAGVVREVALSLDVKTDTHFLKHKIDEVNDKIIHGDMPQNHREFEGKAVLYQLLNELREFLWTQEYFVEHVTDEQVNTYWK